LLPASGTRIGRFLIVATIQKTCARRQTIPSFTGKPSMRFGNVWRKCNAGVVFWQRCRCKRNRRFKRKIGNLGAHYHRIPDMPDIRRLLSAEMGAMATARSGHAANISGSFMPTQGCGHGTLGSTDPCEAELQLLGTLTVSSPKSSGSSASVAVGLLSKKSFLSVGAAAFRAPLI
jgi:hypothetical protein